MFSITVVSLALGFTKPITSWSWPVLLWINWLYPRPWLSLRTRTSCVFCLVSRSFAGELYYRWVESCDKDAEELVSVPSPNPIVDNALYLLMVVLTFLESLVSTAFDFQRCLGGTFSQQLVSRDVLDLVVKSWMLLFGSTSVWELAASLSASSCSTKWERLFNCLFKSDISCVSFALLVSVSVLICSLRLCSFWVLHYVRMVGMGTATAHLLHHFHCHCDH